MFSRVWRATLRPGVCVVAGLLAGCSNAPNSGPSATQVIDGGSGASGAIADRQYEFVDLDGANIGALGQRPPADFSARFGDHRPSAELLINVGDLVSVTIWEASAGGLFSAPAVDDKASAGANTAAIPPQVVERDGAITVPYAGRVRVAGRTPRAVEDSIERALASKAIQPQAIVSVVRSVGNSVSVGGEGVTLPQRVPLSTKGDRLLEVIDVAGGVKLPVNELDVELARGQSTTRVPLARIVADPREDIYVQPGDVINVVHNPETFIAYGATGIVNREIPFGADQISLAQALAKSGGLLDQRSDVQGVFVFRYESNAVLKAIRPDSPLVDRAAQAPVVYRLDLRDPNSLFLEQKFQMANHDVVYVSNAPLVEIEKVVSIFNTVLSPASQTAGVAIEGKALSTGP